MKIVQLISIDPINISRNTMLVADDFSNDDYVENSLPSLFEMFMKRGDIEYGVFRTILQTKCVPNWGSLLFEERLICVKYFKYPADLGNDEYLTYATIAQHKANWRQLIHATTGPYIIQDSIRGRRLVEMVNEITWNLTPAQVVPIAAATKDYLGGYAILNFPHISYWLSNGVSAPLQIDFSSSGFAQKDGYSDALRDKLLDIFNGNY